MNGVNQANLVGTVGADAETIKTSGDQTLTKFRMATNRSWTQNGEKKSETQWHTIEAWGKMGEIIAKVKKGDNVYVSGQIRNTKYKDKEGVDRFASSILAKDFTWMPSNSRRDEAGESAPTEAAATESVKKYTKAPETVSATSADVTDNDSDDLPF